ncbi:MAG: ATP-grasp domain-containing protein [Anaerolineae bacterium]|nr:ATP-grasp domain-containing protein [Anaerolineae bacterium]
MARAARQLTVDGICTFSSDVAVPTVGYVCERLGLPGIRLATAEVMATKHRFRTFLRDHGFAYPGFVFGKTYGELGHFFDTLRLPVLFKPVDTSGSRGVTRLSVRDEEAARSAFEHARSFSNSGTVCVEEQINGIEVGGDGVLCNGCFAFLAITHKHLKGFVVTGHNMPTNITLEDQNRVRVALEACCCALDYTDGPLNFDVMVTADDIIILEMSARNGGNGIPAVIARATGVDVEEMTLRTALGETVQVPAEQPMRGAASWVFGSDRSGTLRSICPYEQLRAEVPEVFDLYMAVPTGSEVRPFQHNGNLIGFVLFDCVQPTDYDTLMNRISQVIRLEVNPSEAP